MMNEQPVTIITRIHELMVKEVEPVYLIPPEKLEVLPLTREVINDERATLHSVSKEVAVSIPNNIFIKQSWGRFKEVRPDLLIQVYSILVEEKNKIPNRLISNSIPHIVILSENQKVKHKSDIMLWQQLFEKGDIFLGRRACLQHKRIPSISVSNFDLHLLGEEKQNIDLGSYWAGYISTYAIANRKDILDVYCSFLRTLLSDRTIHFPVL